ncbi:S-adenosylmethionine-dependent methyltransferases (SAM or AdoMet-MTase) class I [Kitasatospora sp. Ki12]
MPVFSSATLRSAVVSRLRAAGCVFAEDEARILLTAAASPADLAAKVRARAEGRPLEHVVGWAEFAGLRIAVDPGVFVPRRRSEFLAAAATALAGPPRGPGAVVLDLCCGSGALGAAVAARAPHPVELYAADIDPDAVRCARRNLAGAGARVHRGDLFDALPAGLRGRVDVLIANVPYVPTGDLALLPPEARLHEARPALDGGADGLDVLRRVVAQAPAWLAAGGSLLFETSERQVATALAVARAAGLAAEASQDEDLDATVVTATAG